MIVLFVMALSPDALNSAIAEMNKAEKAKCEKLLSTQVKSARMQLELMREVKDFAGAESMAGPISDLAADAKTPCPAAVPALQAAVTILRGGSATAPEPADAELDPEPKLTSPPKQKKTPPSVVPRDLQGQLDALGTTLGPGWKQLSVIEDNATHINWAEPLEETRCYAFIGVAGPSTKRMALYLYDAEGKRRAGRKGRDATAILYYCAAQTGPHRVQAKVKQTGGDSYVIATFVRR